MGESRSTYGLLASALGAILLAVSVFLPWYGISFTAHGIAVAQQVNEQVGAEFGNATLQSYLGTIHAGLAGLVGREVGALSAHQALSNLNVVMLVLAGLGILIALLALAGPASAASDANRAPLALLGLLAGVCVVFRMVDPPSPAGGLVSLSLREGAWLALLGSAAMCAGALWPRMGVRTDNSRAGGAAVAWSELSGWTPEA
ncbi:MAG TPA: hypothetical protein VHW67_03265 [Solirubrobacteraceae bacterium]|jgi:hypothetical protein|nr:hypothetical protein [Solirubrobacteraceae bacterium]